MNSRGTRHGLELSADQRCQFEVSSLNQPRKIHMGIARRCVRCERVMCINRTTPVHVIQNIPGTLELLRGGLFMFKVGA